MDSGVFMNRDVCVRNKITEWMWLLLVMWMGQSSDPVTASQSLTVTVWREQVWWKWIYTSASLENLLTLRRVLKASDARVWRSDAQQCVFRFTAALLWQMKCLCFCRRLKRHKHWERNGLISRTGFRLSMGFTKDRIPSKHVLCTIQPHIHKQFEFCITLMRIWEKDVFKCAVFSVYLIGIFDWLSL